MHSPHNHPDITADPISKIILERDHLRRTITTIRNLFPSEIFRPKNQHHHTRTHQLIWNELQRHHHQTGK